MRGKVDVCVATHVETLEEHWATPAIPDGEEVVIAPNIKIAWLPQKVRDQIAIACQCRGLNVGAGHLVLTYAIILDNAPPDTIDPNGVFDVLLGLSRLIHPSAFGTEFMASLSFGATGEVGHIFAHSGLGAYRPKDQLPWLTKHDCDELGRLYRAYTALPIIPTPSREGDIYAFLRPDKSTQRLPSRLQRALWNFAYAAYVCPSHIRWLIVATALEGLLEDGKNPTQTFIQRTLALAGELGVPLTKKQADDIYSLRSKVAHQGWFVGKDDEDLDPAYLLMDRVVAGAISRAIYDADFRSTFDSEEALAAKWPVVVKDKYCKCGLVIPRS